MLESPLQPRCNTKPAKAIGTRSQEHAVPGTASWRGGQNPGRGCARAAEQTICWHVAIPLACMIVPLVDNIQNLELDGDLWTQSGMRGSRMVLILTCDQLDLLACLLIAAFSTADADRQPCKLTLACKACTCNRMEFTA